MHGIENQDSHAKMGVSTVNVCSHCVCLLYVCICGCFVNGVCIHGLAVVNLRLSGGLQGFTGISVQNTTWEPGVKAYLAMGKFPA